MILISNDVISQCPDSLGIILGQREALISIQDIAEAAAPLLWFSPDEPRLYDDSGQIQLPEAFPFDPTQSGPVVYYKMQRLFSYQKKLDIHPTAVSQERIKTIDLKKIKGLSLEFYFYYTEESGLGQHPHDIESTKIEMIVNRPTRCNNYRYQIMIQRVVARSHGQYWFENNFTVDQQTVFPPVILIEEGKHACCTDKNGDGVYTPGFDVTEKVNDAWGVRDIITTGKLFSGGFQAWMAKTRTPSSLLLPPNAEGSPAYLQIQKKYPNQTVSQSYVLREFPDVPDPLEDRLLKKKIKEKKFKKWPQLKGEVGPNMKFERLSKDKKLRNKIGVSYRFDETNSLSFAIPLLLVKHVEAPLTGGWFYNKIYLGDSDAVSDRIGRVFGHQIQHTNSASRWIDSYVGFGYEILDTDPEFEQQNFNTFLVSEIGMKIRLNITKTPLKFLKVLGTDYWGVRIGWKNIGFNPFFRSGFIVEVGAGAF